MSVEEQVKDIVSRIAHIDKSIISREATFKEMKADSLDIVQALVAVEEQFEIEIPDEDTEKIKTVRDAIEYIKTHAAT